MFFSRLVPNRLSYRVQPKGYTHHYAKSTIAEKNVVIGHTRPGRTNRSCDLQSSPGIARVPLESPDNGISPNQRVQADSRFGITDIAVLCENQCSANLLISFPILSKSNCVKVVVIRFIYDRINSSLKKKGNVV